MPRRLLPICCIFAVYWPLLAQESATTPLSPEIINIGLNQGEIKPGMATLLVKEQEGFKLKNIRLKVKLIKSDDESGDGGYMVRPILPKSNQAILAWRGIDNAKAPKKVVYYGLISPPDQYAFGRKILPVKGSSLELMVERFSTDKHKVTLSNGPKKQVLYDSSQLFSGYSWPLWVGDLDGDGLADFITQEDGGGEYVQTRTITLWLSSLAKNDEMLGKAGSRVVFVGGD